MWRVTFKERYVVFIATERERERDPLRITLVSRGREREKKLLICKSVM